MFARFWLLYWLTVIEFFWWFSFPVWCAFMWTIFKELRLWIVLSILYWGILRELKNTTSEGDRCALILSWILIVSRARAKITSTEKPRLTRNPPPLKCKTPPTFNLGGNFKTMRGGIFGFFIFGREKQPSVTKKRIYNFAQILAKFHNF